MLFFGTLLIFSRGLGDEFLDYDDPDYVTQNAQVQAGITWATARWAFTTGCAGNWHPLTWLSHALDWQLFGNDPRGHHAVNIVWHALNATLAFLALRRLSGAFWMSALGAALFAWHPLRVESVAWIAERKDVLCAFFGLLTLWLFIRFAEASRISHPRSRIFYALALVTFTLGLLSKPMLVTLPFVLALLDYWPLNRFSARTVREKIPFLLLSAAACVITYLAQKKSGAMVETSTLGDRLANGAVSVTGYLWNFFWPFDLAVGYPRPARWPAATTAIAVFILLGITGVVIAQWRRRPFLFVGWLWFFGMLVPVLGIIQVGQQARADRYTYLPMLGLEIALLWALNEFVLTVALRRFATAFAVLGLAGCIARTWDQLAVWQNSHTLFEHALSVTKDNYLAHSCLGATLLNENRLEEACVHFRQAIEIKPDYAVAHRRLGLALEKLGQPGEAVSHYERALALIPDDAPTEAWLADALASLDRDREALSHYRKALDLKPDFAEARRHYADSLRVLERFDQARTQYRLALALQARDAEAYYGLGAALEGLGENEKALACYEAAAGLKPEFSDAQYNIGVLRLARNEPAEAVSHFLAVINYAPHHAPAFVGLGLAAERLGHLAEAVAHYEKALQLSPDFPGVAEKLMEARRKAVETGLREK